MFLSLAVSGGWKRVLIRVRIFLINIDRRVWGPIEEEARDHGKEWLKGKDVDVTSREKILHGRSLL